MRTLAIPGLIPGGREKQYRNLTTAREEYGKAWKAYEALPQEPWRKASDLEAVGARLECLAGRQSEQGKPWPIAIGQVGQDRWTA